MAIVGFTIFRGLSEHREQNALAAQNRALSHFPHLEAKSLKVGVSTVVFWGHAGISDRLFIHPDGALWAVIGSPHGRVLISDLVKNFESAEKPQELQLPWEGRLIVLKVSADGKTWTIWNDWLGSILVFYSEIHDCQIASTLEPVVVAAAGFTAQDVYLPGLVTLLVNGFFISNWTLFNEMKVIAPDSVTEWDQTGIRSSSLKSVLPGEIRAEEGWEDLVDGMYELSKAAILKVLHSEPAWILPLSAGLDSRLIAAVGAEAGVEMRAFSWGPKDATDVVYAEQIARVLGIPWERIDIGLDYLARYTKPWADWFGCGMNFHGMYQMSFLDAIQSRGPGKIVNGFLGDVLSGDDINGMIKVHRDPHNFTLDGEIYTCWQPSEMDGLLKIPIHEAIEVIIHEIKRMTDAYPGARYQKLTMLELWSRQRFFTGFSSTLSDYWRGVATPFMDRDYARFCLSLPRALLDHRRLIGDLFRRHYGKLAVIPGTYGEEPYIRTGRYLIKRRLAHSVPQWMRKYLFPGLDHIPLHMDADSIQACGWEGLWPLREAWEALKEWLDVEQLEAAYQAVLKSNEDIRPVRKLQSAQTLACCLLNSGVQDGK